MTEQPDEKAIESTFSSDSEKERKKLGEMLKDLRENTKLSQIAFVEIFPSPLDNSTLSLYESGKRVPDPDFIKAFGEEVSRRSATAPATLTELSKRYAHLLGLLSSGSNQRGQTYTYQLMLKNLRIAEELKHRTAQRDELLLALQEAYYEQEGERAAAQRRGTPPSPKQQRLEQKVAELHQLRQQLEQRRAELVTELDATRLALRQQQERPAWPAPSPSDRRVDPPQPVPGPPALMPDTRKRSITSTAIIAAFTVIMILGGLLIWRLTEPASQAQNPPADTAKTPSKNTAPSHPTRAPATELSSPKPSPTPTSTQPSPRPGDEDPRYALDKHLTDVYEISISTDNTIDIDTHALNAPRRQDNEFILYGTFVSKVDLNGSYFNQDVKLGLIDDKDIPQCATRARLVSEQMEGLDLATEGGSDASLCVLTSEKKWAVVQVVDQRQSGELLSTLILRIGFVK